LLPLLRGIDIDIDVRVGELQLAGADMQGISLKLSGRDGFLALDALDGMIPGAVVSGQGGWQLEQDQIEGRVAMALSVDNAGELLAALGEPPVLEGTGQVQWHWIQRLPPVDTARLAEGSFELFEGSVNTQSDERIDFRRLAGDFTYSPGVFDVPELGLTLDDGELLGWLSVSLETDEIGGRLIRVEDGREIGLAGAIDRLELSEPLKSDRRPTTENDSPGNGHSDGLQ
jgi:hypothetical protein